MGADDTLHQQIQIPIVGPKKHPCVLCQQRKVKCDRNEPCANCNRIGVECIPASTLPPRRRKRRFPEAELLARLQRYERHLKSYGANIDAINRESTPESASLLHTLALGSHVVKSLSTQHSFGDDERSLNLAVDDDVRTRNRKHSTAFPNSCGLDLTYSSSVLPKSFLRDLRKMRFLLFLIPSAKTYEEFGGNGDDLLFGLPTTTRLIDLHPSPILHAPTAQKIILDTVADLEAIPQNIQALMFGIYSAAMLSMTKEDCEKMFNESKEVVLGRFQLGACQALRNVGFLRSSDFVVLQAFALYLLSSLQMTIDPRSLFCLTGIAVRMAQRMRLSIDGSHYAIPPFEAEMRRRLWWQIILIEYRVAELSGAGTSMVNYVWNTKFPANVNDSDLFPDMRGPPIERSGLTEMTFVRLRCEVCQFIRHSRDITGSLSVDEAAIDEFEQRLEREYLKYCDPFIPLHLISLSMTKSALCKLRMRLRHPQSMSNQSRDLPQAEKDKLFQLSLNMIEIHNKTTTNPSAQRFAWHICTNYPFLAHIYLLWALRYRTNDELSERAWQQISERQENNMKYDDTYFSKKPEESFIKFAIANLTIKAWEVRESALQDLRGPIQKPRFVLECQKQLAEKRFKSQFAKVETSSFSPFSPTNRALDDLAAQFPMFDADSLDINRGFNPSILPGMFPNDLASVSWELWSDMVTAGDCLSQRELT
ncbi:hypothetical protein B7463_g11863, partial [Scytalidium lignicola]